ncbi:MAG: hypothetical protein ACTTHG_05595 [Treponemataceae bacterium]
MKKKFILVLLCFSFFSAFYVHSQSNDEKLDVLDNVTDKVSIEEKTSLDIDKKNKNLELDGIWENSHRKIVFDSENRTVKIQLKNYYGLWLDSVYYGDFDLAENLSLIFEERLYFDYCKKDMQIENLFLPCCNIHQIQICEQIIDENIYGFYFTDENFENALKIRYWQCSIENYSLEDKVTFKLSDSTIECVKYILIGNQLYTCVKGRGKRIRNYELIEFKKTYPDAKFITVKDVEYIILEKPYVKKN